MQKRFLLHTLECVQRISRYVWGKYWFQLFFGSVSNLTQVENEEKSRIFFVSLSGMWQNANRRTPTSIRRVQSFRYLPCNVFTYLQRARKGRLSVLPSEVSKELQRLGVQSLSSGPCRQVGTGLKNKKEDSINRFLKHYLYLWWFKILHSFDFCALVIFV